MGAKHNIQPVDPDMFMKNFDEIMQSGLQFIFFNLPVQKVCEDGTKLWDIKVFWEHVDVKESKGFDTMSECLEDCYKYVKDYDEN